MTNLTIVDGGQMVDTTALTTTMPASMKALMDRLERLNKEREAAEQAIVELLPNALMQFVRDTPGLEKIAWRHWTPYYNDGDPCYFHTSIGYPAINGYDGDRCEWDDDAEIPDELKDLDYSALSDHFDSLFGVVRAFLGQFDKDIYATLFGDHVRVIVTADRIRKEEYCDHH